MNSYLLKNVLIKGEQKKDVLIENGIITCIENQIDNKEVDQIDGKSMALLPGLVDMQVHFREPGQVEKETLETGMKAAVKGGFTTVACMPNTNPCLDNAEEIQKLQKRIDEIGLCHVYQVPAMTKDLLGKEVSDYIEYKKNGIFAITDDGKGVQDDKVMRAVFEQAKVSELSLLQHCEVEEISHGHPIHDGQKSKELGIEGQSGRAESEMVNRDLNLLEEVGGHYHVLHVSSKRSLEYIELAKQKTLNVTCEVTPHHLVFCDEDIPQENTNFKMNLPLRSRSDREALVSGIQDGLIDFITTDHAPHTTEEKSQNLEDAPFGIVGLETALPVIYTYFVKTGIISMNKMLELMCFNPLKIFGLSGGQLNIGDSADLVLIDFKNPREVRSDEFASKGRNTPFEGHELYGWSALTLFQGRIVYKDENYEL